MPDRAQRRPQGVGDCFAAGTRIATADGAVAVEDLDVGDLVRLARGGVVPVAWLGFRDVDCRRHPRPREVWPVRVAVGAFGRNRPSRALLLSPDHAVLTGGALIPVRHLLNGGSVTQTPVERISYWHVELAQHAALLAEQLPCESYLDAANRSAFVNGGRAVQMHPAFGRAAGAAADGAAPTFAPLVADGPRLARAKARLIARLPVLGFCLTTDPALRLRLDGQDIEPDGPPAPHARDGEGRGPCCRLGLPAGAGRLTVLSRVARPADLDPASTDDTPRGVALLRLRLDGIELPLHHKRLAAGWLPPERALRWSTGAGEIDVSDAASVELTFGDWQRYTVPAPVPFRQLR